MVLILAATVPGVGDLRAHPHWDRVVWMPHADPHGGWLEITANVLLFVPFGWAGARGIGGRAGVVLVPLAALALSTGVEVLQLFSHGRFSTTRDILANLAGALIGLLIARRAMR